MRHLPNRDVTPSEIDRDRLGSCEVYLGIFGFRWGSASAANPLWSYTEEEYELAGEMGIPRRIFLLSDDSSELEMSPAQLGYGEDTYAKQMVFRSRVAQRLAALVRSPQHLATAIATSLADLEREVRTRGVEVSPATVPRRNNLPVRAQMMVRRAPQDRRDRRSAVGRTGRARDGGDRGGWGRQDHPGRAGMPRPSSDRGLPRRRVEGDDRTP